MPLWAADCPPSWPLPCTTTQISTIALPSLFGNVTRVPALRRKERSSGLFFLPVPCPAEATVPPRSCPTSQPAQAGSCQTFLPRDIPRDTWMTPPPPEGWCHVCVMHRLGDGRMPARLGTGRGTPRKSGLGSGLVTLGRSVPRWAVFRCAPLRGSNERGSRCCHLLASTFQRSRLLSD